MTKSHIIEASRVLRHSRIRKKIVGTPERLRLCVHRSHKNLSAQLIDDNSGKICFGMSTVAKAITSKVKFGGNVEAAGVFGELFGQEAQKKGYKKVSFDRGGYFYHGRVKAFAEGARKSGMEF